MCQRVCVCVYEFLAFFFSLQAMHSQELCVDGLIHLFMFMTHTGATPAMRHLAVNRLCRLCGVCAYQYSWCCVRRQTARIERCTYLFCYTKMKQSCFFLLSLQTSCFCFLGVTSLFAYLSGFLCSFALPHSFCLSLSLSISFLHHHHRFFFCLCLSVIIIIIIMIALSHRCLPSLYAYARTRTHTQAHTHTYTHARACNVYEVNDNLQCVLKTSTQKTKTKKKLYPAHGTWGIHFTHAHCKKNNELITHTQKERDNRWKGKWRATMKSVFRADRKERIVSPRCFSGCTRTRLHRNLIQLWYSRACLQHLVTSVHFHWSGNRFVRFTSVSNLNFVSHLGSLIRIRTKHTEDWEVLSTVTR